MAQWLLQAAHIIGDAWLPAGTVVGDGTAYPIDSPTPDMGPLDKDALAKTKAMFGHLNHESPGWRAAPTETVPYPPGVEPPEPPPAGPAPATRTTMADRSKE